MNKLYPFKVLSVKEFYSIDFERITLLYGGNGSGKSTALNAIANKLGVARNSAYNKANKEFYDEYISMCDYEEGESEEYILDLKDKTTLITSDDIFKYMLDTRQKNGYVNIRRDKVIDDWFDARKSRIKHINFETGEGLDEYKHTKKAKKQTCYQYVSENLGAEVETFSNGETGFMRFIEGIVPDRLYLLDEPENSLSCELQMKLAEYIERSARYFGCQFIIATHSPFLLAIQEAKIYDLDSCPVTISKFWELPNMMLLHNLFKGYDSKF